MPIFEFECPHCKTRAEKFQKYDDPPPRCTNGCVGRYGEIVAMNRMISTGSWVLKGTGWYATDFKGKT